MATCVHSNGLFLILATLHTSGNRNNRNTTPAESQTLSTVPPLPVISDHLPNATQCCLKSQTFKFTTTPICVARLERQWHRFYERHR